MVKLDRNLPLDEGTRIVERPPNGGKARRYYLGRKALPMIWASKTPVSPVIAYR